MIPTIGNLSAIETETQESYCATKLCSTPPAKRTRAQLKHKAKEHSGKSKKTGMSKRFRKK